jgi:hypothetical protein
VATNANITDRDPVIDAYKKDIDRTLLRENLKLSVEDRLRQLMELQKFAEELGKAGRALKPEL